ncbi:hypothetical protein PIB30_017764 [Stylosanthes scabra]|uniref:Uncharacterized protein n=1 Tax=Stylosanthes scabra TaxID=79078 RepID=A0ABU6T9P4_9FABA|nr:hypothetical protein [Stylosanthes scabra]
MQSSKFMSNYYSNTTSSFDDDDESPQRWSSSRRGHEFWYARRTFLKSYHLSLEKNKNGGFKEKLKKSVKEVNEAAIEVVSRMRRGVSKKKLGMKTFKVKMTIPSLFLVTIRCFIPWLNKRKDM